MYIRVFLRGLALDLVRHCKLSDGRGKPFEYHALCIFPGIVRESTLAGKASKGLAMGGNFVSIFSVWAPVSIPGLELRTPQNTVQGRPTLPTPQPHRPLNSRSGQGEDYRRNAASLPPLVGPSRAPFQNLR